MQMAEGGRRRSPDRETERGEDVQVSTVTEAQVLEDLERRQQTGESVRQFACPACKHKWWQRVPNRKPVSSCNTCHDRYDAIPRDQEWGTAKFECKCGHKFTGFGAMGRTSSKCYTCRAMCLPLRINPPSRKGRRQTDQSHTCSGRNCFNREGHVHSGDTCVHPKSQPPEILVASQRHVSTGSTILSQDDQRSLYDRDLEDIYSRLRRC